MRRRRREHVLATEPYTGGQADITSRCGPACAGVARGVDKVLVFREAVWSGPWSCLDCEWCIGALGASGAIVRCPIKFIGHE